MKGVFNRSLRKSSIEFLPLDLGFYVETSKAIFYVDLRTFLAKFHKFRSISTYLPFLAMMKTSLVISLKSLQSTCTIINHHNNGIHTFSLSFYIYWGDSGGAKPLCASTRPSQQNIHISVQKLQMMKLHLRHCKSMIKPIQSQPNLLLSLLIHISVIAVVILLCWERQRNQQQRRRHRYPPTN